ncbi:hypothetical protein ASPFODRAFT_38458 [Aspergillus luchuensis CBS 106.47]|uniref:Uncharacterized protein n=1 Tax=Aspergillus luchuensis (strain CBS 106.47) TaxID=1137211 RepID=A0A1M3SZM5_ASPLC|nr:hypothetical protein ASPFODRAFT_38458 [Aspergillus luchuensis CBS 106.47]
MNCDPGNCPGKIGLSASSQKVLQQSLDTHRDNLDRRLEHWDHNLIKTQSQNNQLSDVYLSHLKTLETTIQQSFSEVKDRLRTELESSSQFQRDMVLHSGTIEQPVATLERGICEPLSHLQASIQSCLSPISASLEQVSDYTSALPRFDNRASFTSLVHKESKETDTFNKPKATPRSQENRQFEQPYLEAISDDSEQPPLKRRRL